MFDIGGFELVLIGIVALLVMGDDFPSMFRKLGQFTGKMRKMAREFSRAMEEAADDAGVKDVTKTLKTATSPKAMGLNALDKAADTFEKWEAGAGSKRTATQKAADVDGSTESKAADAEPDPAKAPSTAKKPAAKKPAARKPAAKKPAAKKPAAKKAPAKTTAAKKPAARKTTTKAVGDST